MDIQADPGETKNLLYDPAHRATVRKMENRLYEMMGELGGMDIPLNPPRGGFANKRLRGRGGDKAADFPDPMVVDEPINRNAR